MLSNACIKAIAESIGIPKLNDNVASALAQDVEYRLREISQEAIKFMHHSKRTKLLTEDINHALTLRNIEPLYGFTSPGSLNLKRVDKELFYATEEEIDLEKILNEPLPQLPHDIKLTGHWLAIEGVQPAIPENPCSIGAKQDAKPEDLKPNITENTTSTDANLGGPEAPTATMGQDQRGLKEDRGEKVEVKPRVKHVLTKELQMYYEKIIEAVESGNEKLRKVAFSSIQEDPGIHQLVPYFIQYVAKQMTSNMKNVVILENMLQLIDSLLANSHIFLEPYLHQLMPLTLSCILARRLGDNTQSSHWHLRQQATSLIARICTLHGDAYPTLRPRVTKTLLRAFLDPRKPFCTHYGAIIGLSALGKEVVKVLLLPNLKQYGSLIEKAKSDCEISDNEFEKITQAVVDAVVSVMDDNPQDDKTMTDSIDYGFFNPLIEERLAHEKVEAMDES